MLKFAAASLLTLTAVVSGVTGCGSDTSKIEDAIARGASGLDAGSVFGSGAGGAAASAGGATGAGGTTAGTGGLTNGGTGGSTTATGGAPASGGAGAAGSAGATGSGGTGTGGSGGAATECDPAFCPQDSFGTPCCVEATGECGVDMGMGCVQTMPSNGVDGG